MGTTCFFQKALRVAKVGTSENKPDMLTKFLSAESLGRHSKNVGYEFPVDNFQVLNARDTLTACSELEVRFKNFTEHLGIARAQEMWITSQPLFKEAQRQPCAMISANSQCFPVLCVRIE